MSSGHGGCIHPIMDLRETDNNTMAKSGSIQFKPNLKESTSFIWYANKTTSQLSYATNSEHPRVF